MFAEVAAAAVNGIEGVAVTVEANISSGFPAFCLVGLPDAAVREARERIRAAVENAGYSFPDRRIVVNLSPANVRKEGSHFDLAIAMGILLAEGVVRHPEAETYAFLGELSLDGSLRPVPGALPLVMGLRDRGYRRVVVPLGNREEARNVQGVTLYPAEKLSQVIGAFSRRRGEPDWEERGVFPVTGGPAAPEEEAPELSCGDFAEVMGQESAKRALVIAAAGFHNVLLMGPPGSGKTMLARRIPGILPPPAYEEMLELTRIYSVAGALPENAPLIRQRPFRAPHHSASAVSLVGGGAKPKPGEVTLAHSGVLFLDELPEFQRHTLEMLRQPMEEGEITVTRTGGSCRFPCRFFLVAAMNPCPCGYYGHPKRRCTCSDTQVRNYLSKISGPLVDRIDLQLEVYPPAYGRPEGERPGPGTKEMRQQVLAARKIQEARFAGEDISCNGRIPAGQMDRYCPMEPAAEEMLRRAYEYYGFSARALQKIRRLSRTIADLEGEEIISALHCGEAMQYQCLSKLQNGL